MASGAGSPCGACKFLRRKCMPDCIFAPYFCTDQGADRFAAVHKIFGASNASKLLSNMPPHYRWEAVVSIAYEAQARIHDPVYGCVAHIFALQQQVAVLQAQLMQARAQLAQSMAGSRPPEDQWEGNIADPLLRSHSNVQSSSPQSSLECSDYSPDGPAMGGMCFEEGIPTQSSTKRKAAHDIEWGELQDLAMRMMRN